MLKYYIPLSFREMSKKFLLTNTIASWYILYRMEFFIVQALSWKKWVLF